MFFQNNFGGFVETEFAGKDKNGNWLSGEIESSYLDGLTNIESTEAPLAQSEFDSLVSKLDGAHKKTIQEMRDNEEI